MREQAMAAYQTFLDTRSNDWRVGMGLLFDISDQFGAELPESFYVDGVRNLARIKPSFANREEMFFRTPFALPMAKVKQAVADVTANGFFGIVQDTHISGRTGTKHYAVPVIHSDDEFMAQVASILDGKRGMFAAKRDSKFVTFGSCFAVNLGQELESRGYDVYSLLVSEDVNSTLNNALMLRWMFERHPSTVANELAAIEGMDFDKVRAKFLEADEIVMTLGNIFHLSFKGTPTLQRGDLIVESIAETYGYLRQIFSLLEKHTKANIIVSLSPVPISGYRGDVFASAVEADCSSKSQLRAVLREIMIDQKRITYMQTFELFRWIAAHEAFATYGVDDCNSRHISRRHIALVMDYLTTQGV